MNMLHSFNAQPSEKYLNFLCKKKKQNRKKNKASSVLSNISKSLKYQG